MSMANRDSETETERERETETERQRQRESVCVWQSTLCSSCVAIDTEIRVTPGSDILVI